MNLQEAPRLAFKNRDSLQETCSCYYCLKTYPVKDIVEWTDQQETALCPHCNIDAVVPGPVDVKTLEEIHKYWFVRSRPPSEEDLKKLREQKNV